MADPRANTFAAFADDDEPKAISTKPKEESKKEENTEKPTGERRGRRGGRYRNRGPRTSEGEGESEGTYERRGGRRGRGGRYRGGYPKEEELVEGKAPPKKEGMEGKRYEGDSDKVHPYDRHSGTGTIKPEYKKGGHGKFNTGKPEDDVKEEEHREYRPRRRDDREEKDEKPQIETISYKDILKNQKAPEAKEEKKEVKKAEAVKADMSNPKEPKLPTKNYRENLHTVALEGDTSKLAGLKIYEKRTEEKREAPKKPFILSEHDFPSLC